MQRRNILFAVLALLLSACASNSPPATPTPAAPASTPAAVAPTAAPTVASASGLTSATIANDEGGPVAVAGQFSYTNAQIAEIYALPTPLLFNVSRELVGDFSTFTATTGQILGAMTSPLVPSPASYRVGLPIEPVGPTADLDNNGRDDVGVTRPRARS
ncbi:MAG: hypothetical protein HGA45_17640 [Chloroflexales bacterium]|nr:hypothetical protein [Chloroflexales bacterium]